jgi:hypothetical protein
MRVHNSAHRTHFTELPNAALRDHGLSFTARGILAHLLSLPDGAREDVRTLADRNPRIGRSGVANALEELVEQGYYVRRTTQDATTGQVRTETHVYDTPQRGGLPVPARPGTGEAVPGEAVTGKTGTSPEGVKDGGKEPSLPAVPVVVEVPVRTAWPVLPVEVVEVAEVAEAAAPAKPAEPEAVTPTPAGTPAPPVTAAAPAVARAAALLLRITTHEPKLALSAAEALALAPLAVPWLDCGVSDPEARALLTAGLPPVVFSARAVLANRLHRKLPPPRTPRDAAAPAAAPAECAECRDPLPPTQETGICTPCTGAEPRPAAGAQPASVTARVAALREAVRGRTTPALRQGA